MKKKQICLKWRKTKDGNLWCPADKYVYGIKNVAGQLTLIILSQDGLFSYSLRVKDIKTAKQIAEAIER